MAQKLFPIGVADFEKIRSKNFYYVDKTPLIIELLNTTECVFLSRPRRFGKSLTLDTIAELFSGNKDLFKGLYAENHWDWETTYPIIRLSFAGEVEKNNVEQLRYFIENLFKRNAYRLGIEFDENSIKAGLGYAFQDLILKTQQKYQKQVVILIDEYDKPILDNINHSDVVVTIRNILKTIYSQLKDLSAHIRFAMLTGVSKFGQMSIFSGLNHIRDITLVQKYSTLCGYTQSELENIFVDQLFDVDLNTLKHWYNGYNWSGESVYNPFDVLLFLANGKQYKNYWIETGGNSSFLFDLIEEKQFDLTQIIQTVDTEELLSSFDIGSLEPLPIMFQAGYLTIDQVGTDAWGSVAYSFKFPNFEVRISFTRTLLERFTQKNNNLERKNLLYSLQNGDIINMQNTIKSIFAAIPHDWHRKNNIAHYEGYWASLFFTLFASSCTDIRLEDATYRGRIDMTVIEKDFIYLFEFKMKHSADSILALQQIEQQDYAAKYQNMPQKIYKIGVCFDEKTREIDFTIV